MRLCMTTVTVDLYDGYTKRYSVNDWARIDELIGIAVSMGHKWKSDEYQGQPVGWLIFNNEADAVMFKLMYL